MHLYYTPSDQYIYIKHLKLTFKPNSYSIPFFRIAYFNHTYFVGKPLLKYLFNIYEM